MRFRNGMRDDQRRAMFANMRNCRFAEKSKNEYTYDENGPIMGSSYKIETGKEPDDFTVSASYKTVQPEEIDVSEVPQVKLKNDAPTVEMGGRTREAKAKPPEKLSYKKDEGTEFDFKTAPYEAPFILGEYVEYVPEPELVKKKGFWERISEPITIPIDIVGESFGKTLREEGTAELQRIGSGAARGIVTGPRRIVQGTKDVAVSAVKGAAKAAPDVIRPGAEAFGTVAGRAVSDVIAVGADIMEAPNREFWTPPGVQPVWTGTAFKYERVPRYPMEPFAVSKSMGLGMPPGMDLRIGQAALIPTLEAAKLWGGEQFVSKERGYGGADVKYTSKDFGMMGEMPPLFQNIPTPDFWKTSSGGSMNWLIPPREIERGTGAKIPPRQTRQLLIPRTVSVVGGLPSIAPSISMPESKPVIPLKNIYTKVPPKEFPSYPRKMKLIDKPITMGRVPRSVMGALGEQQRYESAVSEGGASSPEAIHIQAKMQSKADYAARHTEPGTPGRYLLESSGLLS